MSAKQTPMITTWRGGEGDDAILHQQPRYNCSSGCPTRDHKTWGECVRSKRLNLNPNLSDTGRQKQWDSELDAYDSARRQGVEPEGTTMTKVNEAMRKAEACA